METITLRPEKELDGLSKLLGFTTQGLSQRILEFMVDNELAEDSEMDCGRTVRELLDFSLVNVLFCDYLDYTGYNAEILEKVVSLVIYNKLGDCPNCGNELEIDYDGCYGETWTETKCHAEFCGYSHSTEPDFDEHLEER